MKVTGNGTFPLDQGAAWSASALYPEALGGASVVLQVNGVNLTDGVLADETQIVVYHGKRAQVNVVVSGFTTEFEIQTYEV